MAAVTRSSATLRATGLAVSVGGRRLLQDASLEVERGQLVALIGPSGSGKTTLLRALAGVLEPDAGSVTLGGDPIGARSSDVGHLPYGDTIHERLSPREALDYAAGLRLPRRTTPAEAHARVDAVLDELDLTARADTRVAELSSGERKRASVAVELLSRPELLLLDEPATGLDPSLERRLMVLLRGLADHDRAVVLATHATSSLALCDLVAVMAQGGRLAFVGPPAEALAHFGVGAYDEIYDALGEPEDPEGSTDLDGPRRGAFGVRRAVRLGRPQDAATFGRQLGVLLSRYATTLGRDGRTLLVLLAQAPIIGVLVGVVLPHDVLASGSLAPFYGVLLAFLLLTGSIWLGVISACREIVKERVIVERELAVGVRLDAYVVAKALVLFALVLVQVLLLILVVVILQPLHARAVVYLDVVGLCVLAGFASTGLGLLISARARSSDQASAFVPLLLLPQLLLAGAIIPAGIMPGAVKALSVLTYSRWGLQGIGHAMALGDKISGEVSSVAGYQPGFFDLAPAAAAGALACFIVILLVATGAALGRRRT